MDDKRPLLKQTDNKKNEASYAEEHKGRVWRNKGCHANCCQVAETKKSSEEESAREIPAGRG